MYLGEKIKMKKIIKNALNNIKEYEQVKSNNISKYLAIFFTL